MKLTHNDLQTYYLEEGEGPEHVTLVHGVGAALDSWDAIAARLASRYRLLRYDLRGHGASGKPPGPYSLDQYVDDLRALLDHCGIARTTLVGFSFGAMIGPAFVLAHPDRAARVAIVSGVCGRTEEERSRLMARADQLDRGGAAATVDAALERWFTPEFRAAHPDIIEARRRRSLENDPKAYAAAYRVFAEGELGGRIHEIRCPALIMTGEHDPGSNVRMANFMHDRIDQSKLEILAGLRHSVLLEAPQLVASHIETLLDTS